LSGAADIDRWLEALGSADRTERLEAHVELLPLDAAAVAPGLGRLLSGGPVLARREAAWLLAHLLDGAASVRPAIERAIDDRDPEVSRWAVEALRRLDDPEAARQAMLESLSTLTERLGDASFGGNADSQ
jgi:HEAT repeat protein